MLGGRPVIDGFKALLVRFEFSVRNWMSLHFIAFHCILLHFQSFSYAKSIKNKSLNSFKIKRWKSTTFLYSTVVLPNYYFILVELLLE